ncbi:hypothetical protein HDU96_010259 [Phlyctochytrium bullatum]|nr:hypothetical protein HDU96_010259 [Phlyctochytrium bullatum]
MFWAVNHLPHGLREDEANMRCVVIRFNTVFMPNLTTSISGQNNAWRTDSKRFWPNDIPTEVKVAFFHRLMVVWKISAQVKSEVQVPPKVPERIDTPDFYETPGYIFYKACFFWPQPKIKYWEGAKKSDNLDCWRLWVRMYQEQFSSLIWLKADTKERGSLDERLLQMFQNTVDLIYMRELEERGFADGRKQQWLLLPLRDANLDVNPDTSSISASSSGSDHFQTPPSGEPTKRLLLVVDNAHTPQQLATNGAPASQYPATDGAPAPQQPATDDAPDPR